jgi:Tfp pilus assembly protein FimT
MSQNLLCRRRCDRGVSLMEVVVVTVLSAVVITPLALFAVNVFQTQRQTAMRIQMAHRMATAITAVYVPLVGATEVSRSDDTYRVTGDETNESGLIVYNDALDVVAFDRDFDESTADDQTVLGTDITNFAIAYPVGIYSKEDDFVVAPPGLARLDIELTDPGTGLKASMGVFVHFPNAVD